MEEALTRYANNPGMREPVRIYLRSITRRHKYTGLPLTGSFYWAPRFNQLPDGKLDWRLLEFFDVWPESNSDHVCVWKHVRDVLQVQSGKRLTGVGYACLPRGRVCEASFFGPNGQLKKSFKIYHGNDCPIKRGGMPIIRRAFNLPRNAQAVFDEHEQMLAVDTQALEAALRIDLGLRKGVR
jgi:hypothetical protein